MAVRQLHSCQQDVVYDDDRAVYCSFQKQTKKTF